MFDVLTLLDLVHRICYPIADADEFEAGEWGEASTSAGSPVLNKVAAAVKIAGPAFAVFQATEDRTDRAATGEATVVYGVYIADTDQFESTETYSVGDPLTVEGGILVPAIAGDIVVAHVIIPPADNPDNANHLRYSATTFYPLP